MRVGAVVFLVVVAMGEKERKFLPKAEARAIRLPHQSLNLAIRHVLEGALPSNHLSYTKKTVQYNGCSRAGLFPAGGVCCCESRRASCMCELTRSCPFPCVCFRGAAGEAGGCRGRSGGSTHLLPRQGWHGQPGWKPRALPGEISNEK